MLSTFQLIALILELSVCTDCCANEVDVRLTGYAQSFETASMGMWHMPNTHLKRYSLPPSSTINLLLSLNSG